MKVFPPDETLALATPKRSKVKADL